MLVKLPLFIKHQMHFKHDTESNTNIIFFCYPNREINVQSKQYKHYSKLWSLFTITKLDNGVTLLSCSNMLLLNFGETL